MGRCRQTLKNYSLYLSKLTHYATSLGLKITIKPYIDDGAYIPTRNEIVADNTSSQSKRIAVLLHEFGHHLDLYLSSHTYDAIDEAYSAKKPSKIQRKLIIECEKIAWSKGRTIAKMLKIPLGKWFDETEKDCLSTYMQL